MFAVYRLALRNPAQPPAAVIDRLREELPGVEIGADGQALVFMAEDADLGPRSAPRSSGRAAMVPGPMSSTRPTTLAMPPSAERTGQPSR
jgi:hypothetical protein